MKWARFFIIAGIFLFGIWLRGHSGPESAPDYQIFVDQRDNRSYNIVKIGNQWWFAENLDYAFEGSFKPEDEAVGRLYDHESAKQACPPGFHLPSDEEWIELERFLGIPESELFDEQGDVNRGHVAHKIKKYRFSLEPENNLEYNTTGFSAVPAGYFVRGDHNHRHTTAFWTGTSKGEKSAYVRGLNPHTNGIGRVANSKEFCFSVRCIKD